MKQTRSSEAKSHSASQDIPCHFWNTKVHYRVPRARHWSLSWAKCILSTTSHHISVRSIIILSYHLRLGLPIGLFPSCFPTKILRT